MKIVVYTAITGCYDTLKAVRSDMYDCDFICFTDTPVSDAKGWTIRPLPSPETPDGLDAVRLAKHPKIMPHAYLSEYEVSVWIDGSYNIRRDFLHFVKKVLEKSDLVLFRHAENRKSIYEEAAECIAKGKDDIAVITEQVEKYKKEGFFNDSGIPACNIIIRKHNEFHVTACMEKWWDEVCKHSKRDQISFDYACFAANKKYMMLPKKLHSTLFTHWNHGETEIRKESFFKILKKDLRYWYYRMLFL